MIRVRQLLIVLAASGALAGLVLIGFCTAEEAPTGPVVTGPAVKTAARPLATDPATNLPRRRIAPPAAAADEQAIRAFVTRLVGEMTRDEKIGQMSQVFPPASPRQDDFAQRIRRGDVGSIFYTGDPQLVRDAQRIAVEESRLGIPLIIGRDVIHGFRTVLPIPLGQAATWNPELLERGAAVAAAEARRVGVHWTFAPMVDIVRDPRWGRVAESLGEDPVLASALGAAMVRGLQQPRGGDLAQGIAACPKHFVAYGLAEGGRDYNTVMVSCSELQNVYLRPFRACVDAGALTLMTSFNTVNGVPATGHERLVQGVVKDDWRFRGFVVSDWGSIPEMIAHGFSEDERSAALSAASAGVDMEMSTTCYQDHFRSLVAGGRLSESQLDEAVARILRAKCLLGLFEQPYADVSKPELLNREHRETAREIARQSLVLLKNDGALPLDADRLKRVAVIGPLADAPLDQLGTWSLDGRAEDSITPLAALRDALGSDVEIRHVPCMNSKYGPTATEIANAVKAAEDADAVLMFVGEEAALSGEGHSRTSLELPGSQSELVAAVAASEAPLAMIVLAGRPLAIGPECDAVDAVLYAWHPGTMGGPAIADVLLGAVNPSGKLPVTFPKSVGQAPLYYNHASTGRPAPADYQPPPLAEVGSLDEATRYRSHYVDSDPFPLFPFGYGLSYTTFAYDGLELSRSSLAPGQTLAVHVRVKNVGQRPGTETVQLYIRDVAASIVRPVRELKAFRRVTLEPGAAEILEIAVSVNELGYFGEDEQFVVEPGDFKLFVGGSSAATLSTQFEIIAPRSTEARVDADAAVAETGP